MKKKNMKNILRLVLAVFLTGTVLLSSIAVSEEQTLLTLDYQEGDLVFLPGNVTLVFNSSDTGDEDVIILWRIYSPENNLTIFYFKSQTITYDSSFINNTKEYLFNDTNSNTTYAVYVNYSSIHVPDSIEDILNMTIKQKNELIGNLTLQLENLTEQLNATIIERDNWKAEAGVLKIERDNAIARYRPLEINLSKMEDDLEFQQQKNKEIEAEIHYKESIISSLENTISQLRNPWCTGYEYNGRNNGLHINYSSLIIGLALAFIIFFLVETLMEKTGKQVRFGRKKTLGDMYKDKKKHIEEVPVVEDHETLKKLREKENKNTTSKTEKKSDTAKDVKTGNIQEIENRIDMLFSKNGIEVQ